MLVYLGKLIIIINRFGISIIYFDTIDTLGFKNVSTATSSKFIYTNIQIKFSFDHFLQTFFSESISEYLLCSYKYFLLTNHAW